MSNFLGRLAPAAFLPVLIAAISPGRALAYNEWQMEHDQATVNQLSQEGILSAPQAMYLDQSMYDRRVQSWMNGQGLSNNTVSTPYGMMPAPVTSQARAENRQIDKLQRDHFITWQEANSLKNQVKAQASSMLLPQASVSAQLLGSGSLVSNSPLSTNGPIMGTSLVTPMAGTIPVMGASPMVGTPAMIGTVPVMTMGSPYLPPSNDGWILQLSKCDAWRCAFRQWSHDARKSQRAS